MMPNPQGIFQLPSSRRPHTGPPRGIMKILHMAVHEEDIRAACQVVELHPLRLLQCGTAATGPQTPVTLRGLFKFMSSGVPSLAGILPPFWPGEWSASTPVDIMSWMRRFCGGIA